MLNKKDIIAHNLKVTSEKEVSIIYNDDQENYLFSALTIEGGGVFKKGIAVGMQDKMVPGLIIYDNENFYGFSEKNGLSLMSPHNEYIELTLPDNFFESNEKNILQPSMPNVNNSALVDLKETEKNINKNLNIDIQIKDINNFYILIPNSYTKSKFELTFDISFIYDLNIIISNLSLAFINNSNKNAFIKIVDNNNNRTSFYYEKDFLTEIMSNTVYKINLEIINENNFIISSKSFMRKN
jgi:hypothetical protein